MTGFVIPGVIGKPISVRDFTSRFQRMSGDTSWFTLVKDSVLDATSMFPRAGGVYMKYSAGTPQWNALNGRDYALFNETDVWRTPNIPVGNVITMAGLSQTSIGSREPFGCQFANEDLFWVAPYQGGTTGIRFTKSGVTYDFSVGLEASMPLNSVQSCLTSFNRATGQIKFQTKSATIYETVSPELIGLGGVNPMARFSAGMGSFGQRFTGTVTDFGFGHADWFTTGGAELLAEYTAHIRGA